MKYIFEIEMKPGYPVERYAEAWLEASRIIQQADGARGTYLHRNLNVPNKLLAIAHWDSKAQRDAGETLKDPRVKSIIDSQARFVTINLVGEYDEPDWSVLPGG